MTMVDTSKAVLGTNEEAKFGDSGDEVNSSLLIMITLEEGEGGEKTKLKTFSISSGKKNKFEKELT